MLIAPLLLAAAALAGAPASAGPVLTEDGHGSLTIEKTIERCDLGYCADDEAGGVVAFTPGVFPFVVEQLDPDGSGSPIASAQLTAEPTRFDEPAVAQVAEDSTLDLDALPVGVQSRFSIREVLPSANPEGRWRINSLTCNVPIDRPDPDDPGLGVVTIQESAPAVSCLFVNEFVPSPSLALSAVVTGPEATRKGPVRIELSCNDGTAESLEVALGKRMASLPVQVLDPPEVGPNRVECQIQVVDAGAPRSSLAGGDAYPDPGTEVTSCNGPPRCTGVYQRSVNVVTVGGEQSSVEFRVRYGEPLPAVGGDGTEEGPGDADVPAEPGAATLVASGSTSVGELAQWAVLLVLVGAWITGATHRIRSRLNAR